MNQHEFNFFFFTWLYTFLTIIWPLKLTDVYEVDKLNKLKKNKLLTYFWKLLFLEQTPSLIDLISWSLLYSAILCSRADSLCSCPIAILNEWLQPFITRFEYPSKRCTYSAISLLHGWCHVKLLPSCRTFFVHHAIMRQFTVPLHSKPQTWGAWVWYEIECVMLLIYITVNC